MGSSAEATVLSFEILHCPVSSAVANADSTAEALIPVTRITLLRLLTPAAMVTDARGTFKRSEKKRIQASFPRPSTGTALSSNFNASPRMPEIWFRRALGWTLTANVTPFACCLRGIKLQSAPLTEDRCADAHASGALFDGNLEIVRHAHRTQFHIDPG